MKISLATLAGKKRNENHAQWENTGGNQVEVLEESSDSGMVTTPTRDNSVEFWNFTLRNATCSPTYFQNTSEVVTRGI